MIRMTIWFFVKTAQSFSSKPNRTRQSDGTKCGEIVAQTHRNLFWLRDFLKERFGVEAWVNATIVFTNAYVTVRRPLRGVEVIRKIPGTLAGQTARESTTGPASAGGFKKNFDTSAQSEVRGRKSDVLCRQMSEATGRRRHLLRHLHGCG
jgi:hypothetical protein